MDLRTSETAAARVAVVGPGGIGGGVAAAVDETGRHELTIASRNQLERLLIQRDGQPERAITATLLSDPAEVAGPVDWVFFAVKAHQTDGAGEWLKQLCGPSTTVVVLQNGVSQREDVAPYVGPATVLPATVWIGAQALAAGVVHVRDLDNRLSVPDEPAGHALAALLDGGWIDVRVVTDFVTEAWTKLCFNAVAGLTALTGRGSSTFLAPESREVAWRLAAECVAVGRAEGADLRGNLPDAVVAKLAGSPPDHASSILVDRKAGRPLEWSARNGVIQRLGARHGIPTPVSDVIVPLLAAASVEQI